MNPIQGASSLRFKVVPDLRQSIVAAPVLKALAALRAGLARGDPFLLVTGDAGTGKTTVGRRLLEELEPQQYELGGVFGSGKDEALLSQVVQDFGERPPRPGDAFLTLENFVERWRTGRREAVLVIDEAQAFDSVALWRLWQLASGHAAGRPRLHVVLMAEKEPAAVAELARHGNLLLFGTRWQLQPLQESETGEFVLDRLRTLEGRTGEPAFDPDALLAIHQRSGGVLRQVCLLCDRIQMWMDMEGVRFVDARVVEAVDDLRRREWSGPRPEEAPAAIIEPPAPHRTPSGRARAESTGIPVLTLEVPRGAHRVEDTTLGSTAATPAPLPGPAPSGSSAIAWHTEPHVKPTPRSAPRLLAGVVLLVCAVILGLGSQSFLRDNTQARDRADSSSSVQVPRQTISREEGQRPAPAPPAESVAAPPTAATPSPPDPVLAPLAPATPRTLAPRPPPARRPLPSTAAPTPSPTAAPVMAAGPAAVPCSGPAETMGLCAAQPRVSAAPSTVTPIPPRPAPPRPCSAERAALGLCDLP